MRLDGLAASLDKVDLSEAKDGGIVKQVISRGVGFKGDATPVAGDKVQAHYTGTLLSGAKFDSSRDRQSPFEFTIGKGEVIPCWDKAMITMKKGEQALLTCSAANAYGDRGAGEKIPPGATLRFEVEMLGFGDEVAGKAQSPDSGLKVEL